MKRILPLIIAISTIIMTAACGSDGMPDENSVTASSETEANETETV